MKKNGLRSRALSALLGASLAASALGASTIQPSYAATSADVSSMVLVLDDGSPMVGALVDRMKSEGQPYTVVDLSNSSRPTLDANYLATTTSTGVRANFSGVVAPTEAPGQLSAAERQVLHEYEQTFKVREFVAYTWANPAVGLNYAANPGYVGPVDGMTAQLSDSALAGDFSYLRGRVGLDDLDKRVDESWGYLATPLTATETQSFTPVLTATIPGTDVQGSLLGVHSNNGVEQMVSTFASNANQQHWRELSHGIVSWLTRGVSLTYQRNFFSVQIDDVMLPDALWSIEGNCTIGDGCDPVAYPEDAPGATSRMTDADVQRQITWQKQQGISLDVTFNAGGVTEYKAENGGADPLEAALLANKAHIRWLNHTWSHPYLGCVQNFATAPWTCATTATGATKWVTAATINSEITQNKTYAKTNALPNWDATALVTGEHSGLKTLPQMPADNPNLKTALNQQAIRWIASDASREKEIRKIGRATTVPRHPMNIFYNNATKAQAVSEYNWIYASAADGGSGYCTLNPATTTCIKPLSAATGFDDYIVPMEGRIALGHLLANDPRPHYAHQANLAEDGILYPVLDTVLDSYRETYASNSPLVNPSLQEAGAELVRQSDWAAAKASVSQVISGTTVTVTNAGSSSASVPVTLPAGSKTAAKAAFGSSYAGQASAWVRVAAGRSARYTLPSGTGFATSVVWPVVPDMPVTAPAQAPAADTTPIELPAAVSEVIDAATAGS